MKCEYERRILVCKIFCFIINIFFVLLNIYRISLFVMKWRGFILFWKKVLGREEGRCCLGKEEEYKKKSREGNNFGIRKVEIWGGG